MYVAREELALPGVPTGLPGFGLMKSGVRLTAPDSHQPSTWAAPAWLNPLTGGPGLTYHPEKRWNPDNTLRAAARGQEFVADIGERPDALNWLARLFRTEPDMRVHTYVIATDAGAAPNYDPPFVTLAVCKPVIRRKANVGDLVLAFAGKPVNPYEPHTVVWAGVVAEKLMFAEYWHDPRFAGKKPDRTSTPDNFYRPTQDGALLWIDNSVHGPEAAAHDTGGAYVLARSIRPGALARTAPCCPNHSALRMTHGRRGQHVTDLSEADWRRLETWLNSQAQVEQGMPSPSRHCTPSRRSAPKTPLRPRRSRC